MSIRCRHCGSLNEVQGDVAASDQDCAVCGRALGLKQSKPGSDWAAGSGGSADLGLAKLQEASSNAETMVPLVGHGLGTLPSGDEQIDISSILDGSLPDFKLPEEGGWRIQTARGIVYEVDTVEQVSSRLADWTDLSQIKISRGLGPFMPLDSFPEFAVDRASLAADPNDISQYLLDSSSVDYSGQSATSHQADDSSALDAPQLDFARASDKHGAGKRVPRRGVDSVSPNVATFSDATRVSTKTRGFRTIAALSVALLAAGYFLGDLGGDGLAASQKAQTGAEASLGATQEKALQSAEGEMAKGNHTAAAQILQRLAQSTKSPRVYRALAISLSRTNRPQEAKRALEKYRKYIGSESHK